jgi:hypothetical protein
MVSQALPDLVLAELRRKLSSLNPFALLVFAASGILTGPILLLLRKTDIAAGLMAGLRGDGMDAKLAEQLVGLLIILAVCWAVAAFIEELLLPWLLRGAFDNDIRTPLHFKSLNDADAVLLAPIIKAANGLQFSKVALAPGNTGWRFEFRAWMKYPLMVISAGVLLGVLDWLVH